jgi:uncharacterized membrane protein
MATDVRDLGDTIGTALGQIAREATHAVSRNGHKKGLVDRLRGGQSDGALSGMRGIAAGAALAAAAPLAARGAERMVRRAAGTVRGSVSDAVGGTAETAKDAVGGAVGRAVDQAGGAPGLVKEAGKRMLPGGGDGGGGADGAEGVGKGRRMPVQQAVDVGVPLRTAYDQWTQFEDWPQFMHRVVQATQEDDCTVSFKVKVWGMSKEFSAQIEEQRPDERIAWRSTEGVSHSGVVTFHEIAPRLTRVQVSLDVDPGSLVEKAARGMRHVKRAVRADLHRWKSFVEMQEEATGGWRGTIRDGEVVEAGEGAASRSGRPARRARRRSNGQHARAGGRSSGRRRARR